VVEDDTTDADSDNADLSSLGALLLRSQNIIEGSGAGGVGRGSDFGSALSGIGTGTDHSTRAAAASTSALRGQFGSSLAAVDGHLPLGPRGAAPSPLSFLPLLTHGEAQDESGSVERQQQQQQQQQQQVGQQGCGSVLAQHSVRQLRQQHEARRLDLLHSGEAGGGTSEHEEEEEEEKEEEEEERQEDERDQGVAGERSDGLQGVRGVVASLGVGVDAVARGVQHQPQQHQQHQGTVFGGKHIR